MDDLDTALTDEVAGRRGIQSIETGVRLLRAFCALGGPASLKHLSDKASMPASKAHRYLSSFIRSGLARQDPVSGCYDLGPLALKLGLAAMSRIDIVDTAAAELSRLSEQTGFTTHLCLWSEHGPIIVRTSRGRVPLVTSLGLGTILPLTRSAAGKVFLAFLPPAMTAPVLEIERGYLGGSAECADIEGMIAEARARRMGTVDGSVIPGLASIGGPILDWQNDAACAITMVGTDPAITNPDHPAAKSFDAFCRRLSEANGATI